jgi:adenylosuccinate synthase
MKAYVVIGACFGDEGKGLTTDYLSAKHVGKNLVVRFNGGAQAGHTVQTPSGLRHVFKHFGSGSLAGAATYLSDFFICNPILFGIELKDLRSLRIQPKVYVSSKAIVTTPYDMMINQIVEEFRSRARHGSCGVGINETVERNLNPEFALQVADLLDEKILQEKLIKIQSQWVKQRLAALKVDALSKDWQDRLASPAIVEFFLQQVKSFLANTELTDNQILQKFDNVIFEGAQGLLLDEVKGFFPHVTRSSTGLKNVIAIANDAKIKELEVYYVARAYLTRHGAGPLPFELQEIPYAKVLDATNIHNLFQGSLRFSWMNLDLLQQAITSDLADVPQGLKVKSNLMVTCMDQVDPNVHLIKADAIDTITKAELLYQLQAAFPNFSLWQSQSPTRENISALKIAQCRVNIAYDKI